MASKLKYVMFDNGLNEIPLLFPEYVNHGDVANLTGMTPVSAGFVEFQSNPEGPIKAICYGQSIGLNLRADENDGDIIESCFKLSLSNRSM